LKYVAALLNSRLYYYWLYNKGKLKGKMLELYVQPLSEIPLKKISKQAQEGFIYIVNEILKVKKSSLTADTSELEKQIDQMIYKLYNLTEEEIKIVEEA